jgi:hypothetical protein
MANDDFRFREAGASTKSLGLEWAIFGHHNSNFRFSDIEIEFKLINAVTILSKCTTGREGTHRGVAVQTALLRSRPTG